MQVLGKLQIDQSSMPRRDSMLQIATFLLSAVISLSVYNVKESLSALKELTQSRIDGIERRLDRHETREDARMNNSNTNSNEKD